MEPRPNWVKSVPSAQPLRAPSANTSAVRASALLPGAHDLDGWQAAFAITLDDHHVVAGHARHDVGAFRFPIGGLDTRHLARSRDNRLAGAGVAMPPRVFPGDVDVEPDMAVVLDAAHVQTATDQLGDELLDKGCLAGIMTPDDGRPRGWGT